MTNLKVRWDLSFLLFLPVGGLPGEWVLKLKLMLTQPSTELELELGLSLAKFRVFHA